jgi:hypothetical protein
MRHAIAAGFIVAATVVSTAQTSSVVQPASANPITVTGCLGAGPDQNSFTLTTSAGKPGPVGTAGTIEESTGRIVQKPDIKTVIYTIEPIATVDLRPHVGHTVEVKGVEPSSQNQVNTTEKERPGASTAAGGEQPKPTVETTAKTEIVARRLTVSAVKQIAKDCRVEK